MLVDETIANIKAAVEHWRAADPRLDAYLKTPEQRTEALLEANELGGHPHDDTPTPVGEAAVAAIANVATGAEIATLQKADWLPPVIGSPLWFLEEVAEAYGQARTDYLVDEIAGLKVVQREELSEPIIVLADGSHYTVVPDWARRTAEQLQAEEQAKASRIVTPPTDVVA